MKGEIQYLDDIDFVCVMLTFNVINTYTLYNPL